MKNRGQWIAAGGLAVLIGIALGAGLALTTDRGPLGPGVPAPDIQAVDVRSGATVRLSDYHGSVVLLNVWATWCQPCEQEMPSIQRLHERFRRAGFAVAAISIDKADAEHVRRWTDERGLTFDILHDPEGRVERIYQTTGVPESFVIDREGVIVKREIGAREWDAPAVVAFIDRLLAAMGDSSLEEEPGPHASPM